MEKIHNFYFTLLFYYIIIWSMPAKLLVSKNVVSSQIIKNLKLNGIVLSNLFFVVPK